MKKLVQIEIVYSQALCGELSQNNIFNWCPLVDNDTEDSCILYKKELKLNKNRYPYRCTQCRKRNKV